MNEQLARLVHHTLVNAGICKEPKKPGRRHTRRLSLAEAVIAAKRERLRYRVYGHYGD